MIRIILIIIILFIPLNWFGSKLKYRLIDSLENIFIKVSHLTQIRPLNVNICEENLLLLDKILTSAGIEYWLSEGTALGVARDQMILPWDDDLDISFKYEYKEKFMKILPVIIENGFVLSWVTNDSNFLGFVRKNEKIDIDIVQKDGSCNAAITKNAKYTNKCNDILPYLKGMRKIKVFGKDFNVPGDDYLEFLYGDWKTPQKN